MGAVANLAGKRLRQVLAPLFDDMERRVVAQVGAQVVSEVGGQVAERIEAVHADLAREAGELGRMLRIQGDADDEVVATLGRTLLRLSAEVEALASAVARLEQR